MLAVKDNRQYTITQADVDYYQSQGFDILDDAGNIQTYGAGKTIAYSAYTELKAEYDALKRYTDLETSIRTPAPEVDQLKARRRSAEDK